MAIDQIIDNEVQTLSGGELQRVAIVLALAKPCNIYLIDEPSAYLDSEQRVIAAKVMKRWIMSSKRAAFVVEHDFIMATYLADKVIVFDGEPAKKAFCSAPESLVTGMNRFLKMMNITFRRDPTNFRPRINKENSVKDQEQKLAGNYFLLDESDAKIKEAQKKLEAMNNGEEQKVDKGNLNDEDSEEDVKGKKAPKKKGGKKKRRGDDSDDEWV